MKKYTKRISYLNTLITEKSYPVSEAILLLKELASTNFIESTEVHIALNIDPKYTNQQLRTNLILPHGTGKELKIAAFVESEYIQETLKDGASIVGSEDLLEEISKGNLNFDLLITTPSLMPKLAKFGKILGPKGLMPSPKAGTVTHNIKETINEFKKGKLEYRTDKTGIVHFGFGKTSFSPEQLEENLISIFNSVEKSKPVGVKGKYFKSFFICTTMSPSLKLELSSFKRG